MRSFECFRQEATCARRPVFASPEDTDICGPNATQMQHRFDTDMEQIRT